MSDATCGIKEAVLMFSTLFAAFLLLPSSTLAENNPLLPQPQKVQYGSGHLLVRTLSIRLSSPAPTEEDRFAVLELSRLVRDRTGIRLASSGGAGPAIVLERTGNVDALPAPGEQPGPDSRERYDLRVTPTGVEIRGRSSAAVFYGAQTLVQLVEGQGAQASLPEVEIHDWPVLAYRMSCLPASRARFLASLGMISSKSLPLHLCSTFGRRA